MSWDGVLPGFIEPLMTLNIRPMFRNTGQSSNWELEANNFNGIIKNLAFKYLWLN
jgi:hypothetical protein